jgi:DNA-binding PadR family transcriptional regulator
MTITPMRAAWLAHLALHGETPWAKMPKSDKRPNRFAKVLRGATNQTWSPMVDAGWITLRCGQRNFREPMDHLFTITDAGRTALARHLEGGA